VLDDRHGQAEHVQFLERIGAHHPGRDLAGDADHRYRIEQRIGKAGDQIGGAGAGGGHAHADPTAAPGITVRGQRRALLVAHQHVMQARAEQGVVERHDGAARITEQDVDALGFQCLHQPARCVHAAFSFGAAATTAGSPSLPSQLIAARSFLPICSIG